MKIAIQGGIASYHHLATKKFYTGIKNEEIIPCETFKDVFDAVSNKKADRGVVATENSLFGTINEQLYNLDNYDIWVSRQVVLPVNHCLASHHKYSLRELSKAKSAVKIYTQTQAFAQVRKFLAKNLPEARHIQYHDTALAVKHVVNMEEPYSCAIASEFAAEEYEGHIIEKNIMDTENNRTTFVEFTATKKKPKGMNPDAGIMIVTINNEPGRIIEVLTAFKDYGCNVGKILNHHTTEYDQDQTLYIHYQVTSSSRDMYEEIKKHVKTMKVVGEMETLMIV